MYFFGVEVGEDLEVIFRTPDTGTDTIRLNQNETGLGYNLTVEIIYYEVHTQTSIS